MAGVKFLLGYVGEDTAHYWLNGTLNISPLEQMELVKELCGEAWGMAAETVAAVRQGLLIEENEYGALYGKTGMNLLDETGSRTIRG